ncbi:thioesterase family protein [Arthrobacter terrae]|nr:thioesterase family protein [Arthrobacter terrae]
MTGTGLTGGALPRYRCTVAPEWIDYNGHMSEAFYVLVFGYATDQVMVTLGMDAEYRNTAAASLYTVEAHVRYLAETSLGDELEVSTVLVESGPKKLHLAHEMRVVSAEVSASADAQAGPPAATEELLALHVNTESGRTVVFGEAIRDIIANYTLAPGMEPPDWVGRTVNR